MANKQLDCRNMNCPMPIVEIAKAFKTIEVNDVLIVTATDPAFKADVEAWIRRTGNLLVSFQDGIEKVAVIQKSN